MNRWYIAAWACSVVVAGVLAGYPSSAQKPAWSRPVTSLALQQRTPVLDVHSAGGVTLIMGSVYDGLSGVDRSTGRLRWKKPPPQLRGHRLAMVPGDETDEWRWVGTDGETALLRVGRSRVTGDPHKPYEVHREMVALNARSGRQLWARPLDVDQAGVGPLAVFGSVLVMREKSADAPIRFIQLGTGEPIDPTTVEGHTLLLAAATRLGRERVLVRTYRPFILHLRDGSTETIPLPRGEATTFDGVDEASVYLVGDRILGLVDTDDGGVGHSSWPKYLSCLRLSDLKEEWRFRKDPVLDSQTLQPVEGTGSRLRRIAICPAAGTVVAQEGWNDWLHGIRIRDGRPLWRRRVAGLWIDAIAPCGGNVLLLANSLEQPGKPLQRSSLLLIDPRTGRTRHRRMVTRADHMRTDAGMIYIWGELAGGIRCEFRLQPIPASRSALS